MTPEMAIDIFRRALTLALLVSAPMLAGGLVIGLIVSVFQAVTQIHEMTLTFIPKILTVVLALVLFLPWMTDMLLQFTVELFQLMRDMTV